MDFNRKDIAAGDILLFHSKSFVSWTIRAIDGTEANHVAIAMPDDMLAEAGGKGLQAREVPQPGGGEYILVHRFKDGPSLQPVVDRAKVLLDEGHLYAYQQIVLLAVLCLTRRIPLPRLGRRMVRSALDHAAGAVMDLLPVGASWMICSEYVYRAYHEAVEGDTDVYEPQFAGISFAPGEPQLLDWALEHADDVTVAPAMTFGPADDPAHPAVRAAAIEADLAPLVIEYAKGLYDEGLISDADLPPIVDPSFGLPPALPPEPTDEEMLASVARFSIAYASAQGVMPPPDPAFAVVGAVIAGAALKGAIAGLKKIEVEGNFVTPGDFLRSPSYNRVGRLG